MHIALDEGVGVGFGALPKWVVNFCEIFLCFLTPFNAAKAHKAAQVDPVDESRLEGFLVILATDGLHLVNHSVMDYAATVLHCLVLLKCIDDQGYMLYSKINILKF